MHKLIVFADPFQEVEIFEVLDDIEGKTHKISQLRLPQESVDFIKNYSESLQDKVEVVYVGPKDYVTYFVSQVNKFDFVKASMCEDEKGE